ncbi:CvpA family protein [Aquabacterium sp.]|uniref:CvpA family protein n=1 Tax=Aquabacterium sp. TaxID=1872578 RepID=UPI002C57E072|nr:CvpA family protein [Aquabacterium sp.]HSW07243.1 CvpA family protein [Aquabacterium sp.]
MAALGWVDMVLLGVLLLSVIVGLWRGLVFELMSLVGWVVAYVLANVYTPEMSGYVRIGEPGSALNQGAAFVVAFILVLVVWSLLARLLRLVIHATPLTFIDRVLGAGFGVLRGVVLLLVAATLIAFTPAARSPEWTASQGAVWLGVALQGLKPMLPAEVARHLPAA